MSGWTGGERQGEKRGGMGQSGVGEVGKEEGGLTRESNKTCGFTLKNTYFLLE